MDIKDTLLAAIEEAARAAIADGVFPEAQLPNIILEVPPKKEMGDFATNFAMQSAKAFRMNPRKIAEEVTGRINGDWLERVEIAGPGFINFFLKANV
ncbi:MAG: arginine--tRNA ligase, partial [Selenomonas sp.]|nr:arginine--tRNA ligase [Selenomonas sp.]